MICGSARPCALTSAQLLRLPRRPTLIAVSNSATIRSLRALEPQICGDAHHTDYLYLLLCLAYLRGQGGESWTQLARQSAGSGDPSTARRLFRQVTTLVDATLGQTRALSGSTAPPARLRPAAFEPVQEVFRLAAALTPQDFEVLWADFLHEARGRDDKIFTPPSIARTMVGLVEGAEAYDPHARFGELLVEFARAHGPNVRVRAESRYPSELRLAGMRLRASGAQVELVPEPNDIIQTSGVLLTNPPFDKHSGSDWLEQAVESLAEDGRAVVLMPYRAGFDTGIRATDVRRRLVEEGAVLAVVALPPRMFPRTSIGVCVWLLRRPTGQAGPVRFVNAIRLGRPPQTSGRGVHTLDEADIDLIVQAVHAAGRTPTDVTASPDAIRQNGYLLHPLEYLDRDPEHAASKAALAALEVRLRDLDVPTHVVRDKAWHRRPLHQLCEIRSGVPHSTLKAASSRGGSMTAKVPVICPRHLRDGQIDADDANHALANSLNDYQLIVGDVLWIRTGAMGGVAMVRAEQAGCLPHTNLLRLRVLDHAELDPAYLAFYLAQAAVGQRIRRRSVQSLTTSLSTATLGGLDIPVPPLAHQQRILAADEALRRQEKEIEERLSALRKTRVQFARHLTEGTVVLTQGE
jgi:type I restriction enzyme M protein